MGNIKKKIWGSGDVLFIEKLSEELRNTVILETEWLN